MSKRLEKLERAYKERQVRWKTHIRLETNGFKRFWKWVWFLIAFPFVWLFYNIRDWRSAICVIISFLLWSCSVWLWYLLALLTGWNTDQAKWFIGIGSAVWVWWVSPVGSPFILLVTITSIGLKALWDKIRHHKIKKKQEKELAQKCPYYVEGKNNE